MTGDALSRLKRIQAGQSKDELKELRKDMDGLNDAVVDISSAVTDAFNEVHERIDKINTRIEILQNKPINIDAQTNLQNNQGGGQQIGENKGEING